MLLVVLHATNIITSTTVVNAEVLITLCINGTKNLIMDTNLLHLMTSHHLGQSSL